MLDEKLLNFILHVNQQKLLNGNFEKRAPGQIRMRQSPPPPRPQTTRYGTNLLFSLHDARMKFPTRTRISFRAKTGINSIQERYNEIC